MAGAYHGGSTIIHAAGATAGVVDETLRGERRAIAFPAQNARERDFGTIKGWVRKRVFQNFVRKVEQTRLGPSLTEAQTTLLDGFLLQAQQFLETGSVSLGQQPRRYSLAPRCRSKDPLEKNAAALVALSQLS